MVVGVSVVASITEFEVNNNGVKFKKSSGIVDRDGKLHSLMCY